MVKKIAYVDSSVLVKHYVESEKASTHATQLITGHKVYVSAIAEVEVFSALARKLHERENSMETLNIYLLQSFLEG